MISIITYPDSLSFSRNLKKILVAADETVPFVLKKGNAVLLSEVYNPADGYVEINISDVINENLQVVIPSSDEFVQTEAVANFTVTIGTVIKTFTVVKGGVGGLNITPSEFLQANFLSWQQQTKSVTAIQPEWLSYYSIVESSIKCRFYNSDKTTTDLVIAHVAAGQLKSVNVQFARIINLNDTTKLAYFDVWAENAEGTRMTYVQRYILKQQKHTEKYFIFENSLAGLDSFVCTGEQVLNPSTEYSLAEMEETSLQADNKYEGWRIQSTGFLNTYEALWIQDFFRSRQHYVLEEGNIKKIVLQESTIEDNSREAIKEFTFRYRLSEISELLTLDRSMDLPQNIEFPTAEQLFFLAPRLNEFVEADINDYLLIPAQTPFSQAWKKLSVASLLSYIRQDYQQSIHVHSNKFILDKFTESEDGKLLYEGKSIEGDAADETIDLGVLKYIKFENGKVRFLTSAFSDHELSAKGSGGSGSGGGIAYNRLDRWGDYTVDRAGYVLSALLGNDLHTRIKVFEEGGYAPVAHTHAITDITDFPQTWAWSKISGKPSSFFPSAHSHAISEITDLQGALDSKAASNHNHSTLYAPLSHVGDSTHLTTDQKNLLACFSIVDGKIQVNKSFYSTGEVSAKGSGSGGSGSGVPVYERLDTWGDYTTAKVGYVLSAGLGYDLHTRLQNVEAGQVELSWVNITGKPATFTPVAHSHSEYALTSHTHPYLPLTGGTLTGNRPIHIDPSGGYISIKGNADGWDVVYAANANNGTALSMIGFYGNKDTLIYTYIGSTYLAPWLAILPSGNVGIGTTGPSEKLTVAGNIRVENGLLYSKCNSITTAIGARNSSHTHYTTTADNHWFNKDVRVDGHVYAGPGSYNRRLAYVDEIAGIKVNNAVNADTVAGLGVHAGVNNQVNKIVRTDGNGYIYAGWINTTSGLSSAPSRIYCSNDSFIRYLTPVAFHTDVVGDGAYNFYAKSSQCVQTITVAGDKDTYYPVVIQMVNNGNYIRNIITITKFLGQPSGAWAGSHGSYPDGGGAAGIYRYEYRTSHWDGNGGYLRTLHAACSYAPFVAHTEAGIYGVGGLIIYLRGGNAEYSFVSNNPASFTVYYTNINLGSTQYPVNVAPRTTLGNAGIYNSISFPVVALKAQQLETSRTLWGQSFDGTGNVSGALTGVTDLTASGNISAGGIFQSSRNGETIQIGNLNPTAGLVHIYTNNSTSIAFNCTIFSTGGDLGSATYQWHNIYNDSILHGRSINLRRSAYAASGIQFYDSAYSAWQMYMSPPWVTASGWGGNITAPAGQLVTSWALRSAIEPGSGYGWTWETVTSSGTNPAIVAELNISGDFRVIGNISAAGEVSAKRASDERFKDNISPIIKSSEILRRLRPVEFKWNDLARGYNHEKTGKSASFVAQEMQKVLPWAVSRMYDGKYLGIDKEAVIPYLVSGWQEHDNEINTLKRRITELENEIIKFKNVA